MPATPEGLPLASSWGGGEGPDAAAAKDAPASRAAHSSSNPRTMTSHPVVFAVQGVGVLFWLRGRAQAFYFTFFFLDKQLKLHLLESKTTLSITLEHFPLQIPPHPLKK